MDTTNTSIQVIMIRSMIIQDIIIQHMIIRDTIVMKTVNNQMSKRDLKLRRHCVRCSFWWKWLEESWPARLQFYRTRRICWLIWQVSLWHWLLRTMHPSQLPRRTLLVS